MRNVSAMYACYRLFNFRLNDNSHTVIRLAIHEPGRHIVRFRPGQEREAVNAELPTHLTAWFALNQQTPEARVYRYAEIPKHYVFRRGTWHPRLRGSDKIITRIFHINPRFGELYAIRLLLLHVPG